MTKDPKAFVLGWRAEIAAELKIALEAIPSLEAEHQAAEADAKEALDFYGAVQRLLSSGGEHEGMGAMTGAQRVLRAERPIQVRANGHAADLDRIRSKSTRARADLDAARMQVEELRRALDQIDRIVPPAENEEAV